MMVCTGNGPTFAGVELKSIMDRFTGVVGLYGAWGLGSRVPQFRLSKQGGEEAVGSCLTGLHAFQRAGAGGG